MTPGEGTGSQSGGVDLDSLLREVAARSLTAQGPAAHNDLIDCQVCGDAHPGASDCPRELFAEGLGWDPCKPSAAEIPGSADAEYRRSVQSTPNRRLARSPVGRPHPATTGARGAARLSEDPDRDDQPVRENVTRLVERIDAIVCWGIPAIPDIVASAGDLVDCTSPDDTVCAAEELRCIAEDLLGLAATLPDIVGRLCRLADAMEKT